MEIHFSKRYPITCCKCERADTINFDPEGKNQMCNNCYAEGIFAFNDYRKINTTFLQTASAHLKQMSTALNKFRRSI